LAIPPAANTGTVTTSRTLTSSGSKRHRAAHVPAGLHPLDHQQVAAGADRAPGLLQRADLPAGQRPTGVHQLHQPGVGFCPEELHQPGARGGQLDLGLVALAEGGHEVDPERGGPGPLQPLDPVGQRGHAGPLQHPQATGLADGDGQLGGHHPTAHRRLLNRDLAADQLGEGRA
jgi:hypothetical protein